MTATSNTGKPVSSQIRLMTPEEIAVNAGARPAPLRLPEAGVFAERALRLRQLAQDFHNKHKQQYGHSDETESVHLVNIRLAAVGKMREIDVAHRGAAKASRPKKTRNVWFESLGFVETTVHWRDDLEPDAGIAGPAIVEAFDSTIVIPPQWTARPDARGFLHIRRS